MVKGCGGTTCSSDEPKEIGRLRRRGGGVLELVTRLSRNALTVPTSPPARQGLGGQSGMRLRAGG